MIINVSLIFGYLLIWTNLEHDGYRIIEVGGECLYNTLLVNMSQFKAQFINTSQSSFITKFMILYNSILLYLLSYHLGLKILSQVKLLEIVNYDYDLWWTGKLRIIDWAKQECPKTECVRVPSTIYIFYYLVIMTVLLVVDSIYCESWLV